MRQHSWWTLSIGSVALMAGWLFAGRAAEPVGPIRPGTFSGKTQPAPGHFAAIAPQTAQPVKDVRVAVGDVVKKDQILFLQDDDEDRADVKSKEAALASSRSALARLKARLHGTEKDQAVASLKKAQAERANARRAAERTEELFQRGSVAEKSVRDARTEYEKAVQNERSASDKLEALVGAPMRYALEEAEAVVRQAEADVETARAVLDNETVRARVAGTVTRLRAVPGLIGRPGLALWGEIVDTSVLEVRCNVPPAQAQRLHVGQAAGVRGPGDVRLRGQVVAVSAAADEQTELIPVRIQLDNRKGQVPVYVAVQVSFANESR
jgi:multidrug resistance efflux pump